MRAEIFTTPTCIKCKSLKNQLEGEEFSLDVSFIDATVGEGAERAKKLGLRSVPVVYLYNDENEQIGIAHNIDEIEAILNS